MADEISQAFERTVEEGERRLNRTWPDLLATGAAGGLDVAIGVLALLIVLSQTKNELLGALAFPIGFVAISLVKSELFTENFLVPVAAFVTDRSLWRKVLRLWGGTLVLNLVGAWVLMYLAVHAQPELSRAGMRLADTYIKGGIGGATLCKAILGGVVITLMTWMQHSTKSVGGQLLAAFGVGFLLVAGAFSHAVVGSAEAFAALQGRASFGYLDWLGALGWACLGNLVGGIGLVTVIRLVQVGRDKIEEEGPSEG